MSFVHVIGAGDTIASRAQTGGAVVADSTERVLGSAALSAEITTEDVLHINSFYLTFADLVSINEAVATAGNTSDIDGVVITHGTDTMEDTAFFLSLLHVLHGSFAAQDFEIALRFLGIG